MFRALCNLAITAPLMVAANAKSTRDECSTDEWDEATFLQLGYSQKKDKATVSHAQEAADGIERAEDDAEAADSVNASLQQISGISSSRRRTLVEEANEAAYQMYAQNQQQTGGFPFRRCSSNLDNPRRHCEHDVPAGHPCHCDVVGALLEEEANWWKEAQRRFQESKKHNDDDFKEKYTEEEYKEYNKLCDKLACRLCQYKGEWKFFGTISGNYGTSYSVTWGSEGSTSMEQTITEEKSESSMTGGSATVTGEYAFGAGTVSASATVEHQTTEAFSRAVANAVGSSTTSHRSHTATRDFLVPGVVWRAEMSLKNTCGEDLDIFLDEFAMTANLNVYPRCLPGFCQHFGYCCECTAPEFALSTKGDEECYGPFCSPQQTTAYSFGYRGPEKQIGCGQRVEPGGVCHVPCSSMVRGLTGVLTLQCSSATGALSVASDGCNVEDNDDEGFFGLKSTYEWVLPTSWIVQASTTLRDEFHVNNIKIHGGLPWHSTIHGFPSWLSFDAGRTVVLTGFATSTARSSHHHRRYFRDFQFQKSHDGSIWVEVLSGTSTASGSLVKEEFEFPAASSQHWRLSMINGNTIGGTDYCSVQYVEFHQSV